MGRPNGLLIRGDHLFLNYHFFWGQWWLINRGGIISGGLDEFTTCDPLKQFNFEQGILTMWGSSIVWCEQGFTGLLTHDQKSICGSLGSGQSEYGAAEVSCYSCLLDTFEAHDIHTLCLIVYSRRIEYD